MHREFASLLKKARAINRWVVAINADIRDFTAYTGPRMDPVQAAFYLKIVYSRLLSDEFFGQAAFFKSTGDGLMVIYTHEEEQELQETFRTAVDRSLRAVAGFGNFTSGNAAVNFEVPKRLGIGIAHGSASELYAEERTLDFFGRPLNFAARLMDLARPEGVVLDDASLLGKKQHARFKAAEVYLRGIAETAPFLAYYLVERTEIPADARLPLVEPEWVLETTNKTRMSELRERQERGITPGWQLTTKGLGKSQVRIRVHYPLPTKSGKKSAGTYWSDLDASNFEVVPDLTGTGVRLKMDPFMSGSSARI